MSTKHLRSTDPVNLLVLATDLSSNSIGRVHVLWELATHLGWTMRVVAPRGDTFWEPLRGTGFEDVCDFLPATRAHSHRLRQLAEDADLLIAAKPLPGALDRALELGSTCNRPVLIDIDDPDLESRIGLGRWTHVLAKSVLRPHTFWPALRMRSLVSKAPRMVSNPVLQRRYGGVIVAHARRDTGAGCPHESLAPRVVFVGTNRRHKGVATIRAAVAMLQDYGVRLTVTDDIPDDAHPWEEWVGSTSIPEGQQIVREGDIVVLPSMRQSTVSEGQLPAKLIDGMIAARAVIVADLEPLTWATGTAGEVLRDGSVDALIGAIKKFVDPGVRARSGDQLRARAVAEFSIDAIAPIFETACRQAIAAHAFDHSEIER